MWSVLFVVCTLLPSLMCKEYKPPEGLADDEEAFLSRIVKSSEKVNFRKGSHPKRAHTDRDVPGCRNLTVHNGTIINTDESISNGAVFLEAFKNVDSNQACTDHCCKNSSCDTAIFENKDEHKCFLFHCHGNCSFSHHANYRYISNIINRRHPTPALQPIADSDSDTKSDDNNESDREDGATDSGQSSESVGSKGDNTMTTSAPSTAAKTTPAVAVTNILPHSVMLGGTCHRDLHCKDPRAECNFQKCFCRPGFQQKDNVCRKECPLGSFQCQNPSGGEHQCVAKENVCDSIKHCADGSDENSCVDSEKQGQLDTEKESKSKEKQQSSEEQLSSDSKEEMSEKNQPSSEEKNQPSSEEKTLSSAEEKMEEKNHPGSDKESDDASSKEEIQEENPVDSDEKAIDSTHPAEDRPATDYLTTTVAHDGFVSREKVAQPSKDGNLQVPIIALSVGLAFTLILLVFVACRLCRVRRQLRKGRPLHCNEADYLINGMYL